MSTRRRPLYVGGRRRTLAFAVVVAASVVTPLAVTGSDHLAGSGDEITATAGSGLTTGTSEVALASAPDATGVTSDIAGGSAPVKEVTSETPFTMVGVTWKGHHPQASATVRAQNPDGSWGEWFEAESVDGKGESTTGTGGTEPIFLGVETTAVQIRVSGVDIADTSLADAPDAESEDTGDSDADAASPAPAPATEEGEAGDVEPSTPTDRDVAATQPTESAPAPAEDEPAADDADAADTDDGTADEAQGRSADAAPPVPTHFADIRPVAESSELDADTVKAVLLSPDDTPTPQPGSYGDIAASGGTGAHADIAAEQPSIISRAGWGADESIRCRDASYDDSLAAGTVHHTAGSNNYSRAESAGVVRGIYYYHAQNLGWCDIGYNVLVDKYGQAFEGRHGGLSRNVQGAHTGGFNGNTWGISMMGDYSTVSPSDATVRTVGEILGWRLALAGVDPKGHDTHYSEGTSFTKYSYGTAVRLPNIFAHRDVGLTTCPGNAGYAKMDQIRDIAADYAKGGGGGGTDRPSDGQSDTPESTSPRPGTGDGGGATGSTDDMELSRGSVTEAAQSALQKVLSGDRLDATTLTSILTGGRSLSDIPLDAGSVRDTVQNRLGDTESLTGLIGGDFAELASKLSGPLGRVLSGIQEYGDVSLVKTENGALYSSPDTGTHPVWGTIGDAWASQGFERGPLGLPVATETEREDGTIAQRFEHGTLVFDPATGDLSVESGA